MTRDEHTRLIKAKLARHLSDQAAVAVFSLYKWSAKRGCYLLRRTPPSRFDKPLAWAAWQGLHLETNGFHVIGGLMLGDEDTKAVWDEVSEFYLSVRRGEISRSIL